MPTRSTEDYLKYIFRLQGANKSVNTSDLASALNISAASVSEMISKLSKSGLLTNTPYHGFQLTKEGEGIAINLIRKHRLIEVFLEKHLKYNWDEVHSEADKFEHVCSDEFINKLDEYLGFPKFDPHGDPIPDKNGTVDATEDSVLAEAVEGKWYLISKVNDASNEILKYISKIGLKLKSKIVIKQKFQFDKSVLVELDNSEYLLSGKIAENIFVVEAN